MLKLRVETVIPTDKPAIYIQPLTLEKIFFADKSYLKKLSKEDLITIVSTGDIIPGRMVNVKAAQYNDFTWTFKNTWQLLRDADLTVTNLEAPLMRDCAPTGEGMSFCGSDRHIEGLKQAEVDLVTIANNHADNYGQEGIDETIKLLTASNIKYTGLGETEYLTVKNIRLAFLGWNFLLPQDEVQIAKEVSDAKNKSDLVIVFPHWGDEYQEIPSEFQKNMQKSLLNAGADLILGNHPHIIQPLSIDGGSLTFFAHGNFIFDQMWSEETKKGFFAKTYIYKGKIIDVEIFPIYIKDFGQPEVVTGAEKEKMLKDLYQLSAKYRSSLSF